MKFSKNKYDKLDGTVAVRYTLEKEGEEFYVEGGPRGVELKGTLQFTDQTDLEEFAKTLSMAWADHRRLRPKLVSSLSGH